MPSPPRISQSVQDEIAAIEKELANWQLRLTKPYGGRARNALRNAQEQISALELRLRQLKEPGMEDPNITPAPERGPAFGSLSPVFAGIDLDFGRIGVDALKLISYTDRMI